MQFLTVTREFGMAVKLTKIHAKISLGVSFGDITTTVKVRFSSVLSKKSAVPQFRSHNPNCRSDATILNFYCTHELQKKSTLGKDTPFSPGTNDRIVDMIGDAYVFGPTEYLVNLVQQSSAQPIYSYRYSPYYITFYVTDLIFSLTTADKIKILQ